MQIDFVQDKRLFPFQSRWFDGAGPKVHYVDEGAGTPVVTFHGNPTWSFLYRTVINELKGQFRCIAMDYPGFGLSERPPGYGYTSAEHAQVIGKLVDALGLDGFIVVGQDWGGPIGMTVAPRSHGGLGSRLKCRLTNARVRNPKTVRSGCSSPRAYRLPSTALVRGGTRLAFTSLARRTMPGPPGINALPGSRCTGAW